MIPNTKDRVVTSHGVSASVEFGISREDEAHLIRVLRSTIYTDKALAVLREYGANAWDAHRMVGKENVPIKVTLPTRDDPVLTIRDYGPGLSYEDVYRYYTRYGASNKRTSNAVVGSLGLGCKSGFAYSDSFTVTSYHGGMARTYVAVLDASDKGQMNLLSEEECGDETGVEVQVAIKPADIGQFTEKAQKVFQYFEPRPIINVPLPPPRDAKLKLKNGYIYDDEESIRNRSSYYYTTEWVAVMGCIGYRVDIQQVSSKLPGFVTKVSGRLHFGMGEVDITASREELEYSDRTKQALIDKLTALVDEYVELTIDALESKCSTEWDKRIFSQIFTRVGLPVPPNAVKYTNAAVRVDQDVPPEFIVTHGLSGNSKAWDVKVESSSRMVLRDESKRAIKGYQMGYHDYIVRPTERRKIEDIQPVFEAWLEKLGISGIPVVKLSEVPWYAPARKYVNRSKHHKKLFVYRADRRHRTKAMSDLWDIAEQPPNPDDVYVIFIGYETFGFDFYARYWQDHDIAKLVGQKMPRIYGYKSSDSKPINAEDCVGVPYLDWQAAFNKSLLTPERQAMYLEVAWSKAASLNSYSKREDGKRYDWVRQHLGKEHDITKFLHRVLTARKRLRHNPRLEDLCKRLRNRVGEVPGLEEPQKYHSEFAKRYPMLPLVDGVSSVWNLNKEVATQYVKQMDRLKTSEQ